MLAAINAHPPSRTLTVADHGTAGVEIRCYDQDRRFEVFIRPRRKYMRVKTYPSEKAAVTAIHNSTELEELRNKASQYELDYLAARNDMGLEDNNQAVAPAAALVGAEADAEVPAVQPETAGAVPQRLAGQKRALSAELPALPAAAAMGGDSNSSNPAEQPIIQGLPADGIVQGAAGAGVLQEPAVQAAAAGAGAEVEAGVQGGLQAGVAAQAGVQAGAEVLLEPAVQEAPGVGAQAGVLLQPAVQEPDAAEDLQEDEGAEEDYQGYFDDDGYVVDYRNYDYQDFYSEAYGNASCNYSQQEGVAEDEEGGHKELYFGAEGKGANSDSDSDGEANFGDDVGSEEGDEE